MRSFDRCHRLLFVSFVLVLVHAQASASSFLDLLPSLTQVASTVPKNGDVNPYGVFAVPRSRGALVQGNILVSNFNNRKNLQGTGTTLVQVAPDGTTTLFAQINEHRLPGPCPGGVGLTTALVVLRRGWVIVGSLPTKDGTAATAQAGCLLVLNSHGEVVETFSGGSINGPWDMTASDGGDKAVLFVTNVLNGTVAANGSVVNGGTVVRIRLSVPDDDEEDVPAELSRKVIASGFPERTDPNALVIGPTGVGLAADGTLYVANTLDSSIAAISDAVTRSTSAGMGTTVSSGGNINGPLGLAIAPNGNILTTNGGDGNIVETTPGGTQVVFRNIDLSNQGGGTLFGLCIAPGGTGVFYVDDGNNFLDLIH